MGSEFFSYGNALAIVSKTLLNIGFFTFVLILLKININKTVYLAILAVSLTLRESFFDDYMYSLYMYISPDIIAQKIANNTQYGFIISYLMLIPIITFQVINVKTRNIERLFSAIMIYSVCITLVFYHSIFIQGLLMDSKAEIFKRMEVVSIIQNEKIFNRQCKKSKFLCEVIEINDINESTYDENLIFAKNNLNNYESIAKARFTLRIDGNEVNKPNLSIYTKINDEIVYVNDSYSIVIAHDKHKEKLYMSLVATHFIWIVMAFLLMYMHKNKSIRKLIKKPKKS